MAKKKVLFFIPAFPVTSETFIEREILELYTRKNIDVCVVALGKAAKFNFPELTDITLYMRISPIDILSGKLFFLTHKPSEFFATFTIALTNSRGLLGNVYLWLKSLGYAYKLSKIDFDHLHAHFFSQPSTMGLFISMLLSKPFSISGHAKDVFDRDSKSDSKPELIEKKVAYSKFAVLCNKKAYEACLSKIRPDDRSKVYLLYHGVDMSQASTEVVHNAELRMYFVGRFVEKKGLIYLLEAAKNLKDRGIKYRLLLAGYGPDYDFLNNFVLSNDLLKEVTFVNDNKGIDNASSLNYMRHADMVIIPAINLDDGDSDGIPNILLEAGMLSKPVITTDAGSLTEVVVNDINAVVVSQKNELALANAIVSLMTDFQKQQVIATNLHKLIAQKFDLGQNIVQLEKLLLQ